MADGNFDLPPKKTINFFPPLYRQRYSFVNDLVNRHKPKKVGVCFQTFHYNCFIKCHIQKAWLVSKQRTVQKDYYKNKKGYCKKEELIERKPSWEELGEGSVVKVGLT